MVQVSRVRMMRFSPFALAPAIAAVVLAILTGCYRVLPSRQLSPQYRRVYVPLFKNHAYEPDIEENVTRFVQERFLADGRLNVTDEQKADLVLEGDITHYGVSPSSFESDDFPSWSEITVISSVTAYDPLDSDRVFPLGTWKGITVRRPYLSNTRRALAEIDVDAKKAALERLASEIVFAVINKVPSDLSSKPSNKPTVAETSELRQSQIRFRSSYNPND